MTTLAEKPQIVDIPGVFSREVRSAIVVSADAGVRQGLALALVRARWQVREARGGAEAMMLLHAHGIDAMVLDAWLPDLEIGEFISQVRLLYPALDLVRVDGAAEPPSVTARNPRRDELRQAVRAACAPGEETTSSANPPAAAAMRTAVAYRLNSNGIVTDGSLPRSVRLAAPSSACSMSELVGSSAPMRELAGLIEMVASRATPVLIEGETGTGKELVARALHRLSPRAVRPFVVLNCAAIPEALLEAELFGHVRGAFTGAVQSRTGRIESADGGTLLLDEIGEMPLGMQAKMLRFLESGELQKVGENEVTRVDVRLIAATHQPLEQRAAEGTFRLDLYHRLAVFPIEAPALRERIEDIAELAEHFLAHMGKDSPRKRLTSAALERLREHDWPGNVRELMHVLERGAILAGTEPQIDAAEIRYRRASRVSRAEPI